MIEAVTQFLSLLGGLIFLHLAGAALFSLLCPQPRAYTLLERQALSFGLGGLAVTWWMLLLASLNLPFRLGLILPPFLALMVGVSLWRRRLPKSPQPPLTAAAPAPWSPGERLCLALLAALFLFATLRATMYPMWAWDAVATWGFKAKVFYLRRGMDFAGFGAHNYYPNLVPLLLTYLYLFLQGVNDHLVKLVFPLFGAALLALLFSLLTRMGLSRGQSLGLTTFFALSGSTLLTHLYIAYADLVLTYYALAALGLMYLWLLDQAPPGALPLAALNGAALSWTKFEGAPLAATIVLAALLTLLWLRPPNLGRRLAALAWPTGGILLGVLPWRFFMQAHHIEVGSDHFLSFFPHQLLQAIPPFLKMLALPGGFGFLWWAALAAAIISGRRLVATPRLFLALFLAGNLFAILLGYALPPASAEEFPFYIRATLDRLLLHIAPMAALLVGEGLKEVGEEARSRWAPAPSSPTPPASTP